MLYNIEFKDLKVKSTFERKRKEKKLWWSKLTKKIIKSISLVVLKKVCYVLSCMLKFKLKFQKTLNL